MCLNGYKESMHKNKLKIQEKLGRNDGKNSQSLEWGKYLG